LHYLLDNYVGVVCCLAGWMPFATVYGKGKPVEINDKTGL